MINHRIKSRLLFFLIMIAVIGSGLFLLPWTETKQTLIAESKKELKEKQNPFIGLTIEGQSAIVIDATTEEVIFAKNPNQQTPLASITKVMTALAASQSLSPDTVITVNHEALKEGNNAGLLPAKWRLNDLLDYSLVTSSNGASRAVALTFKSLTNNDLVITMNRQAAMIGLKDTYFINPTGLDINQKYGGSYSTAFDMARLFKYILKNNSALLAPTRDSQISRQDLNGIIYFGYNTNEAVGAIPGLLASKTGFTDNAGGNLAIAFDAGLNNPYIAVVLGSSKEKRFTDIKKLVEATMKYQNLLE